MTKRFFDAEERKKSSLHYKYCSSKRNGVIFIYLKSETLTLNTVKLAVCNHSEECTFKMVALLGSCLCCLTYLCLFVSASLPKKNPQD